MATSLRIDLTNEVVTMENIAGVTVEDGVLFVYTDGEQVAGVFRDWIYAAALENLSEADR